MFASGYDKFGRHARRGATPGVVDTPEFPSISWRGDWSACSVPLGAAAGHHHERTRKRLLAKAFGKL
jgi:hypothetical protein